MITLLLASLLALPAAAKERKTDVWTAKGIQLLAAGKTREAASAFDVALKADPKNAGAYANRHTARYRLKDYDGAISDFQSAVKLDPRLRPSLAPSASDAYYQRALARIDRAESEAASKDLYDSVKLDRKNALAYGELGYLALKAGQAQDALEYLDRAVFLKPDFAQAYANRAEAHRALGHQAQMEKDAKRALELSSENQVSPRPTPTGSRRGGD